MRINKCRIRAIGSIYPVTTDLIRGMKSDNDTECLRHDTYT